MQKKLIALAVAAAFSAPAFAEVSVYGVLDAGMGKESKTVTTVAASTKYDQTAIAFSTMTSSRLGFLATEDLDGGAKATLKVETGIGSNPMAGFSQTNSTSATTFIPSAGAAAANGTTIDATTLGNRELNLALAFAQGTTVKAGFGSTLVRDISLGYDAAPGGNLIGNILNNDATLSSNRATSVDVMQQFGAVKGIVSVSKDKLTITNSAGVTSTAGVTGGGDTGGYLLGAEFKQDALAASFAFQDLKTTPTAAATGAITADTSQKTFILGASFDLGVAKLFGEFSNIKNNDSAATSIAGTGTRTYTSLGAQAPLGAVLAFAQVSMGKVNRVTTAATASESRKETGFTVGAKYNMSKATYAYASLGQTNLKAGIVDATASGVKVSQFALGLVKTF